MITVYHHLLKDARGSGSSCRIEPPKQAGRTSQLSTAWHSDDLVGCFKYLILFNILYPTGRQLKHTIQRWQQATSVQPSKMAAFGQNMRARLNGIMFSMEHSHIVTNPVFGEP